MPIHVYWYEGILNCEIENILLRVFMGFYLRCIHVYNNWLIKPQFILLDVSTHFDNSNLKSSNVSLSGTEARCPPLIWHSLSASQNGMDTLLLQKHLPSKANQESGHGISMVPFDSANNGVYISFFVCFATNGLLRDMSY